MCGGETHLAQVGWDPAFSQAAPTPRLQPLLRQLSQTEQPGGLAQNMEDVQAKPLVITETKAELEDLLCRGSVGHAVGLQSKLDIV